MHEGSVSGSTRPGRESSAYFNRPAVPKPERTRYANINRTSSPATEYDPFFEVIQDSPDERISVAPTPRSISFRRRLFIPVALIMIVLTGFGGFLILNGTQNTDKATPVAATNAGSGTVADRQPQKSVTGDAQTLAANTAETPAVAPAPAPTPTTNITRPRPTATPAAVVPPPIAPAPIITHEEPPSPPVIEPIPANNSTGQTNEQIPTEIGTIGNSGNAGGNQTGSMPTGGETAADGTAEKL